MLGLLGGLTIGVVAASRLLVFGKVTGCSGFLTRQFKPSTSLLDRVNGILFLGGLAIGGAIAGSYMPESFENWDTLPYSRLISGGILVGFGTSLGNGCTSGHGISGLSAFRFRSLVATSVFFSTGVVVATLAKTSTFLPFFENTISYERGGFTVLAAIGGASIINLISYLFKDRLNQGLTSGIIFRLFIDVLYAIIFGLALSVANMTKLSAVIAFLDVLHWNPALAFVMGGALLVAVPTRYIITKYNSAPYLEAAFFRHSDDQVDFKLVFGSLCFGAGWGLSGVCPGPATTNLGSGNIPPAIFFAAALVGVALSFAHDYYELLTTSAKSPLNLQI